MRRLLLAAAFTGALALLVGGAAAAPIDWKSLPYFDYSSQRLKLSTNASWSGARPVNAGFLNLATDNSWPKLKRQWIWVATCGTAPQRVVFSKTILVPGVPLEGTLDLMYGPGNQHYGGRPYVSAAIQVNGIEIGRLHDLAHFPKKYGSFLSGPLNARARKAFQYGANTVTIRVERAALKKGDRCTHPAATSGGNVRYVAIGADIVLNFGSDLQAVPPAKTQQVKRDVKNGDPVTLQGTIAVKNNGPSTSLGGTVVVSASGDGVTAIVPSLTIPNAPYWDKSACTFEQDRVTCKYAELPAGAAATMLISAGVKANTGFFRGGAGRLTLMWDVYGPSRDPGTSANGTTQTVVVMCVTGATDPACA